MSKKGKIILFSVIAVLFIGIGLLLYLFFPVVKGVLTGSKYLTPAEGQELYDKGYSDGNKNKNELLDKINYYSGLVDSLQKEKLLYQEKVSDYESSLEGKNLEINNYKILLKSVEEEREEVKSKLLIANNKNTELETKLSELNAKYNDLNTRLQRIIEEKNILQSNYNNARNKITELEETVKSYDNFLQGLITQNQVVAKFYYDNSLYSIMVLQKGDTASVSAPADTTYKKFLGWMVNNEIVDVSNYPINEDTTFIAKINTLYQVNFLVDNEEYDNDIVIDGSYAKVPTPPTKEGYDFDGWMLNGQLIDVDTCSITSNTTFIAKFTRVNSVKFSFKEKTISTQSVRTGNYANDINPVCDEHTKFNYWTLNGIKVDVSSYAITSDVVFVANYSNKYDVLFYYENEEFAKQIILDGSYPVMTTPVSSEKKVFIGWSLDGKNIINIETYPIIDVTKFYAVIDYYYYISFKFEDGSDCSPIQKVLSGNCCVTPTSPTKENYEFDYWTLDKNSQVDVENYVITKDTTFYAKFTKLYNVSFKFENQVINTQRVRENSFASNQSVDSTDRKIFNGWKISDSIINIETYPITSDIVFIADITYRSYVEFEYDGRIIKSGYVTNGTSADAPDISSYSAYGFKYWTLDGENEIVISEKLITEDVKFIAKILSITKTFTNDNANSHTENGEWKQFQYNLEGLGSGNNNFGFHIVGSITCNGVTNNFDYYTGSGMLELDSSVSVQISSSFCNSITFLFNSKSSISFTATFKLTLLTRNPNL